MEINYPRALLTFDIDLDEANTFDVTSFGDPIRVDRLDAEVDLLGGRIRLEGKGLGIKSNGEVGKAVRNVYVVKWEDVPQPVRDIIEAHVKSVKARIAPSHSCLDAVDPH